MSSGVRSSFSMSHEQANGFARWIAITVVIDECPVVRTNGPVPHGPGASMIHQFPFPEPSRA